MRREPAGRRGSSPAVGPGSWLVALPAWGDRCARVCADPVLPALARALEALGRPARVLLYTDSAELPARASELLGDLAEVLPRPVPVRDRSFASMSAAHQDAMDRAGHGERVLLLTADMVLSREVLTACEARISGGMRFVGCAAMRALEGAGAPIGAPGRELLAWAWANRHPMTRECTWPDGRSYDLWRMYFERDGEVAARVFLPHPLAVVPAGRSIHFYPTVDVNLHLCFAQSEVGLITSPDEGAAVELSPPDKEFLTTETMRARFERGGPSLPTLGPITNNRHRMFWGKKVVLCGAGGDCGDAELVERMLG